MTIQAETILAEIKGIYDHQQEIKKLRGEHFNVFSVLQMESSENATHSAFLGELLNPEGSHLFKNTFLSLFLKAVDFEGQFDEGSAHVTLEKHIGTVDLLLKTGGRIDIFIADKYGNTISIENKIYAGDQSAQVERYANYNTERNTVYYLTLDGHSPSEESKGLLEEYSDFHCISYQSTIIKWLTLCMKEAAEQPILRETIRQYILLLKKLTNQLSDNDMEDQVLSSIRKNYTSAKLIADNIWKVELKVVEEFLDEIKAIVAAEIGEEYIIKIEDLNESWTGMTIELKEWNGIQVKLEGQSKIPWNYTIYGIRANRDDWESEDFNDQLAHVDFL